MSFGDAETKLPAIVAEIRKVTDIPVAIGPEISTPEQARACVSISDGAVIGDAAVRIIAEYGENAKQALHEYISEIKSDM